MRNTAEISAISHAEGMNIDESFVSQRIKKYEGWIIKIAFSNYRCQISTAIMLQCSHCISFNFYFFSCFWN